MFNGLYTYRFGGFSVNKGVPHHVVGVGTMVLKSLAGSGPGEIKAGTHVSTATQLTGDAVLNTEAFTLTGTFTPSLLGANIWDATITFTSTDVDENGDPDEVLEGSFAFVPAGSDDRFWLILTGATNETAGRVADEVVSGEAVRLTS
jgi:hypothetical protein